MRLAMLCVLVGIGGCHRASGTQSAPASSVPVAGDYSLGPVAFHEAEHNACGPYLPATERVYGDDLVGTSALYNGHGELCDACLEVTTNVGTHVVARVVTYGETRAPGDVDLSPHAFSAILRPDPSAPPERPRPMSWRAVPCPGAAPLAIQFQIEAHEGWSSVWLRNPRWPVTKVEVRSSRHASFTALRRETDGSFVDDGGFGAGPFTLRIHGHGEPVEVRLDRIEPGALVPAARNFH